MSIRSRVTKLQAEAMDFAPGILKVEHQPPSPLPRLVLYCLLTLCLILLLWAIFGKLDIIAVAQGKLVPESSLQIVQPVDSGVVKELLVKEGDEVKAGQVLVRMDANISEADNKTIQNDLHAKNLQLRRIDAELGGTPLKKLLTDPPELFTQTDNQYRIHRQAYQDAVDSERAALNKTQQDLKGATEQESKLKQTGPIFKEQEEAWAQLHKEGFAGRLLVLDRQRSRIENEQDLRAQTYNIAGLKAAIAQSEKKLAQITSNYRQQLQNERIDADGQYQKFTQDWAKQEHKHGLLELKAPQAGIIKDLSTHTLGTVVSPGTVLMTLVPVKDPMQAEVWVANQDAGLIKVKQPVKLKLAAYPFQQYGMIDAEVLQISPDASDQADAKGEKKTNPDPATAQMNYRALISLKTPYLERDGVKYKLTPGMQATAEIKLGRRTIMEYLLSPVQKTVQEAGRER